MATPTSFISIEDKKEVAMSLAMHFLVYKTKAGLDQLKEGLGNLGIHQSHNQLKPLFLATGKPKVSASAVLSMFKVQWSPQGSNQKESEEAVILGWNEYVHDLEGMLLHSDYKTLL